MLKVFLFIGVLLVASSVVRAEPQTTKPAIRLGATLALSGKLATTGVAQQQALELAVDEINRQGGVHGRKLELLIEDNAGDPKTAVSGVSKLLDVDRSDVLFSSFSHVTQAIQDRVARSGKPMIYAAAVGDIAKNNPLFFRDWADSTSQGESLVQQAAKAGFKNLAMVGEISEGCESVNAAFETTSKQLGLNIISREGYAPGETDFRSLLLRVKAKTPQALLLCTWRDESLFMPQLANLGMLQLPTFHILAPFIPASDTPEMRKLYEQNKSVTVWLGFVEGNLSPIQNDFRRKMQARFGGALRAESALAYDDVMVLAAALRKCPSEAALDASCLARELQKTNYEGVAGPLRFDEFRRSTRPDLLMQVRQGVWQEAK